MPHFKGLTRLARYWGLWPAVVMVLARGEAVALHGRVVRSEILWLTFIGALFVYGADRWVENHRLQHLADRHQQRPRIDNLILIALPLCALPVIRFLSPDDWIWLGGLGLAGAAYLAVTVNLMPAPVFLKECLGAFCFTYLVWGNGTGGISFDTVGFFLMGVSNFLWSGWQDRARDSRNEIQTLAVRQPSRYINLCRASALVGCIALLICDRVSPVFIMTAVCHVFWSKDVRLNIDWAFLPLVAVVYRACG